MAAPMTKPVRSPILGYNHNIQFHGHVFHVQTEDSGAQHARLFTHLFVGGTILASKREQYEPDAPEDAVRLLMQRLHKSMIRELKEGVHDPRIQGFFNALGEQIKLDDRPSLLNIIPGAVAPAPPAPPPAQLPEPIPVDDRPLAVSGSIETPSQLARPAGATRPLTSPLMKPLTSPLTPSPSTAPSSTPPPVRKVVVVKPQPDVKRQPPVVMSSSAEGVVVKRNVVINVGGGAAPVQGQISRGTAVPRPAVPYVVRDGSYPMPTVSRGTGAHPAPTPPPAEAVPSTRDLRMPWDAPASGGPEVLRTRTPGAPSDHTPTGRLMGSDAGLRTRTPGVPSAPSAPSAPSDRTPAERAFASDLPSDKSLDEVILEYLSDDAE